MGKTTHQTAQPSGLAWGDLKENAEDIRYIKKDYIEIRPEATGVWAKDSIPNFAIIGNDGLGKVQVQKAPSGEMKSQPGGTYNQVFNFGPPDPRRCSKFLNLNRWTAFFFYHDRIL